MKEIRIEKKHIKNAQACGAFCLKGKVEGRAAFPDQLVLKPNGKFYWIEFKTLDGSLQDDQKAMHKALRDKGHTIYVCYTNAESDDIILQEFSKWLWPE